MSVQARIMAIADIFEALTATTGSVKRIIKLSECLEILGLKKKQDHIAPDIFGISIEQGL
jgi:HD-GYP domain-containing protein (c-di-GMP phosphodiesterase class II)